MTFFVGQRIICVDDVPAKGVIPYWETGELIRAVPCLDGLTRGHVYTVRDFVIGFDGTSYIRLKEIVRPSLRNKNSEVPYRASRFRPLTERKADLTARQRIFDQMLHDLPVVEKVRP